MAYLIQLILPVYDNEGTAILPAASRDVRHELTERFGGMTAYTRVPAEGTWEDPQGRTHRDDVVIIEVMSETLDRGWWSNYSAELARRFRQKEIVVRAITFEPLTAPADGA